MKSHGASEDFRVADKMIFKTNINRLENNVVYRKSPSLVTFGQAKGFLHSERISSLFNRRFCEPGEKTADSSVAALWRQTSA